MPDISELLLSPLLSTTVTHTFSFIIGTIELLYLGTEVTEGSYLPKRMWKTDVSKNWTKNKIRKLLKKKKENETVRSRSMRTEICVQSQIKQNNRKKWLDLVYSVNQKILALRRMGEQNTVDRLIYLIWFHLSTQSVLWVQYFRLHFIHTVNRSNFCWALGCVRACVGIDVVFVSCMTTPHMHATPSIESKPN